MDENTDSQTSQNIGSFSFISNKCIITDPIVSFAEDLINLKNPLSTLKPEDAQKCVFLDNLDNSAPWLVFFNKTGTTLDSLVLYSSNYLDNLEKIDDDMYHWKINYAKFYSPNQDIGVFDILYYDNDDYITHTFPEIVKEMTNKKCPWFEYITEFARLNDEQHSTQVFPFGVFGELAEDVEVVLLSVDVLFNIANDIAGIKINLIEDETDTIYESEEDIYIPSHNKHSQELNNNDIYVADQLHVKELSKVAETTTSDYEWDDTIWDGAGPTKTAHELSKILDQGEPKTVIRGQNLVDWVDPLTGKKWAVAPALKNKKQLSALDKLTSSERSSLPINNEQSSLPINNQQSSLPINNEYHSPVEDTDTITSEIYEWLSQDTNKITVNGKHIKEI